MSELASLASSGTISSSDRASYDTEADNLKVYLGTLFSETFNGISLFQSSGTGTPSTTSTLSVVTSLDNQTTGISSADLGSVSYYVGSTSAGGIDLSTAALATAAAASVNLAIQNLATIRSYNGAQQNRLGFAIDLLAVNKLNLEAANSRIMELDFAKEIANYTKYSILEETNLVLLSQANLRAENALRLLE
jgi:flagellin